jgi:hypothetical protein
MPPHASWYDEWHPVTVELHDDDGPDCTLHHLSRCRVDDDDGGHYYLCLTAVEFYESGPGDGCPTVSGSYRVRAWGHRFEGADGTEWDGGLEWAAAE